MLLSTRAVKESVEYLFNTKIHVHFAGYLCVRHAAANSDDEPTLQKYFRPFFETFLSMPGGPAGKPYLTIFSHESRRDRWFKNHLGGSYAPSSLRGGNSPYLQVVKVVGAGQKARHQLKEGHWRLAREHLLYKERIKVVPLSAFLFRDHDLMISSPDISALVTLFKEEFGYSGSENQEEYEHLFDEELNPDHRSLDWFEDRS